jgi:hypothetical protein
VAEKLGVSSQALRGWQRGIVPSPSNRIKIEKFLDSQTPANNPAEAELPRPNPELEFGQQTGWQEPELDSKAGEPKGKMDFNDAELAECARRELEHRRRVYRRMVILEKIDQASSDREIAMMEAIAEHRMQPKLF